MRAKRHIDQHYLNELRVLRAGQALVKAMEEHPRVGQEPIWERAQMIASLPTVRNAMRRMGWRWKNIGKPWAPNYKNMLQQTSPK